jgi:hypothetical protein
LFLVKEILDQNRPMCWSTVVKMKPTLDSPIFGLFPSDRIPKATKEVNVHFFIHSYFANEFLSIIPAKSGNFLKLLCVLLVMEPADALPSNIN